MDKVHDVDKKAWISSKKVNLRELIETREAQLRDNGVKLAATKEADSEEAEQEFLEALREFVSIGEKDVKPYFLFNSTDERALVGELKCKLNMYQLQFEHARKMCSDRAYKVQYLMSLRTTRRELLMRHLALTNRPETLSTLPGESVAGCRQIESLTAIVVVQIWPQPAKNTKVRMEREVLFRADQYLTDLRDQFKCQRDYGVPMDLSENPDQAERIFRGELFKSGFFLIEDTFYNDMRDCNNIDLSASIITWAEKEIPVIGPDGENVLASRGIGPFRRLRMEEHKFEDLVFRLGHPYLYMHQGDCEHLFTISDIKYVPNDPNHLGQTRFPFVTATSIGRKADNLRCYMCRNRPPHWYTRNNSRLPVDPYFFCENCFHSFNYDADKRKIGDLCCAEVNSFAGVLLFEIEKELFISWRDDTIPVAALLMPL